MVPLSLYKHALRHIFRDRICYKALVNSTNNQHPILSLFFLNFENMVTRLSIFCFLLMKYLVDLMQQSKQTWISY